MTVLKSIFSKLRAPDRRKAKRIKAHHTLYLNYKNLLSSALERAALGRDLSASGIRFMSDEDLPPGTALNLSLHLYPVYALAKTIQVQGRVVRSYRRSRQTHYRIACEFDSLERDTHAEIEHFASWLKKRNG